jgi:hypothetical protein
MEIFIKAIGLLSRLCGGQLDYKAKNFNHHAGYTGFS